MLAPCHHSRANRSIPTNHCQEIAVIGSLRIDYRVWFLTLRVLVLETTRYGNMKNYYLEGLYSSISYDRIPHFVSLCPKLTGFSTSVETGSPLASIWEKTPTRVLALLRDSRCRWRRWTHPCGRTRLQSSACWR